jgi:hypothetical protein
LGGFFEFSAKDALRCAFSLYPLDTAGQFAGWDSRGCLFGLVDLFLLVLLLKENSKGFT